MSEGGRLGGMAPFMLGAAAMFADMYSTQAILPELGRAFSISDAETGLSISVLILALAGAAWFWGPLSDRIGRRRTLVLSSSLLILPTFLVAIAPTYPLLLAARVLQGLCMPGLLTVGVPYIAEVYTPRIGQRAMGYYVTALVAGGLVGRVGVALLTDAFGWRIALGVLTVLPLAASLMMRRHLPPEVLTATPASRGLDRKALGALLRSKPLIAATIAGSTTFFSFVGSFSYVDFRLEGKPFSLPPVVSSLIFLLWICGAAGPTAGRLAGRHGWRRVAFFSVSLHIVGLLLTLAPDLPLVLVGLACVALGNFSAVTALQVGVAASSAAHRGLASALYFSIYYAVGGIGGYAPGLAWEAFHWTGVVLLSVGVLSLGMVALASVRPRRPTGQTMATDAP